MRGLGNTDSSMMWCELVFARGQRIQDSIQETAVSVISVRPHSHCQHLSDLKKHLREKVNEFPSFVSLPFISCLSLSQTQLNSSAKPQLPPCEQQSQKATSSQYYCQQYIKILPLV